MMCIGYSVEMHGECVDNGAGSVELFHNSVLCCVNNDK